jgi:hypothetical protein
MLVGNFGRPENCSASKPSVITLPPREGIVNRGSNLATGVSRDRLPLRTTRASAKAVNVFVTEPIWKTVYASGILPSASLP